MAVDISWENILLRMATNDEPKNAQSIDETALVHLRNNSAGTKKY